MTDKPIIFSASMVRALLDGRKTQTRRVLKPQPEELPNGLAGVRLRYAKGDRLYVREAWSAIMNGGWTIADARRRMFNEKIVYRADGNGYEDGDGWWPSIHMPREFSRLTLTVTDVRVQRLQDISEADSVAEGATAREKCSGLLGRETGWSMDWSRVGQLSAYAFRPPGGPAKTPLKESDISLCDPKMAFASYFNSIHGPDAWARNDWVWAYSFSVHHGNIDSMERRG